MEIMEALSVVNSPDHCRAHRAECLQAIARHIKNDGHCPVRTTESIEITNFDTGETRTVDTFEMHPTLTEWACTSLESEGLLELAYAVRMSLAYGEPLEVWHGTDWVHAG
jgi:hypothetical protein